MGIIVKFILAIRILCITSYNSRLQLVRAERENAMFPDEVDTPQDIPARVRFQKYVISSHHNLQY